MAVTAADSRIIAIADHAKRLFLNEFYDNELLSSIEFICCTAGTASDICRERIPETRNDPRYNDLDHFLGIGAEVFTETGNRILVRTDLDVSETMMLHIILHEIGHIYADRHEYGGKSFREMHCEEGAPGEIRKGYSVWMEFIAEILADMTDPSFTFGHQLNRRFLSKAEKDVKLAYDPDSLVLIGTEKADMRIHEILTHIFTSYSFISSRTFKSFKEKVCIHWLDLLLELIYGQLHKKDFISIDEDFISSLGSEYLRTLVSLAVV